MIMKKVTSIVLNPYISDSRVIKETQSLSKAGYEVSVVTLHDGREGLDDYEVLDGIPVHRIRLISKSWSKLAPVQMLKYIEFCVRVIFEIKVDIVHCNDLNALPVGYILKLISRCKKIVYDAHELESEQDGQSNIVRMVSKILESILIKKADVVMTVSDGIAEWYQKQYRIEKPYVVMNVPKWVGDIGKQNMFVKEDTRLIGKKIFLYQGGLTSGRGIEYMLDAFARRTDQKAVLMFMGYGYLEEKIKKAAEVSHNIFYHEAVSPEELWKYTVSADYGLVCTENLCLSHYYSLPNKLFEYAMAGMPMILSNLHEFVLLNDRYGFGVVLDELSVDEINKKIDYLLKMNNDIYDDFSKNSRRMAKNLSWEYQEKTLLKIYAEL